MATTKTRQKKLRTDLLLLTLIMLIVSCVFWFSNLDIYLQSLFFKQSEGWFLKDYFLFAGIYQYGPYLSFLIFLASIILLPLSYFIDYLKKYRKSFIFIILFLTIGSGLIVNSLFKDHWGRPRPREIMEFGGGYRFIHHWVMGPLGKNSSFPSGHASVAFFMIFPYFINRKKKAFLTLTPGILWGLLMGTIRMAQGGHFASDVIYAGFFMYLTGLLIFYSLRLDIKETEGDLEEKVVIVVKHHRYRGIDSFCTISQQSRGGKEGEGGS